MIAQFTLEVNVVSHGFAICFAETHPFDNALSSAILLNNSNSHVAPFFSFVVVFHTWRIDSFSAIAFFLALFSWSVFMVS
jgi:hypothetical protein